MEVAKIKGKVLHSFWLNCTHSAPSLCLIWLIAPLTIWVQLLQALSQNHFRCAHSCVYTMCAIRDAVDVVVCLCNKRNGNRWALRSVSPPTRVHPVNASERVNFACIVCNIIFVSCYSRPLTLWVCLEDDEWEEKKRAVYNQKKRERRPVRQAEQRGEDRQAKIVSTGGSGCDSLRSRTEHTH